MPLRADAKLTRDQFFKTNLLINLKLEYIFPTTQTYKEERKTNLSSMENSFEQLVYE